MKNLDQKNMFSIQQMLPSIHMKVKSSFLHFSASSRIHKFVTRCLKFLTSTILMFIFKQFGRTFWQVFRIYGINDTIHNYQMVCLVFSFEFLTLFITLKQNITFSSSSHTIFSPAFNNFLVIFIIRKNFRVYFL